MNKKIAIITGASSGLGEEYIRQIQTEPIDEIWAIARRKERLDEIAERSKHREGAERSKHREGAERSERREDAERSERREDAGRSEYREGEEGFPGVPVRAVPMDLTRQESMEELERMLREEQPQVTLLINAAGFGKIGSYDEIPRTEIDRMIDLNCRAAVDVTLITIPFMQKGSRILEICSTAAFQPFQYLNVYAASKSFLYRFSRALRLELRDRGISVTAVCPYWIKDTEFIPGAKKSE